MSLAKTTMYRIRTPSMTLAASMCIYKGVCVCVWGGDIVCVCWHGVMCFGCLWHVLSICDMPVMYVVCMCAVWVCGIFVCGMWVCDAFVALLLCVVPAHECAGVQGGQSRTSCFFLCHSLPQGASQCTRSLSFCLARLARELFGICLSLPHKC